MHKIVESTAYQVGGGRVGTPWDTVVKQAVGFPPEKSRLLAPPPTLTAAVTVRWHHGVSWGPGAQLVSPSVSILSQTPGAPTGKMVLKCIEAPPSQAHSAFIHTSACPCTAHPPHSHAFPHALSTQAHPQLSPSQEPALTPHPLHPAVGSQPDVKV